MSQSPLGQVLALAALGAALLGLAVAFWILIGLSILVELIVFFLAGADDGPR